MIRWFDVPSLWLLCAALAMALLPSRRCRMVGCVFPWLALLGLYFHTDLHHTSFTTQFFSYSIMPLYTHEWSLAMAYVLLCAYAIAMLLYADRLTKMEYIASMIMAAGGIGICFSGTLITLIIYWEMITLGGVLILWSSRRQQAYDASIRYMMWHILSGVLLFTGNALLTFWNASVPIVPMTPLLSAHQLGSVVQVGAWCVMIAILINAALFPLNHWLTDGYPRASRAGMMMLSIFATKCAMLALWMLFPGASFLIGMGAITCLYATLFGLAAPSIRQTFCYAIIFKMGSAAIMVGAGLPWVAFIMMINHLLYMSGWFAMDRLTRYHQISRYGRLLVWCYAAVSCGLPLSSVFYEKYYLSQLWEGEWMFQPLLYGLTGCQLALYGSNIAVQLSRLPTVAETESWPVKIAAALPLCGLALLTIAIPFCHEWFLPPIALGALFAEGLKHSLTILLFLCIYQLGLRYPSLQNDKVIGDIDTTYRRYATHIYAIMKRYGENATQYLYGTLEGFSTRMLRIDLPFEGLTATVIGVGVMLLVGVIIIFMSIILASIA